MISYQTEGVKMPDIKKKKKIGRASCRERV